MRHQILAVILSLVFTWVGVREVSKPSPEIPMPLKEEDFDTPVQIVEELGKEIERDPPKIHMIEETVKSKGGPAEIPWVFKIFYIWLDKQKVSQKAPDIHKPVKESKIESTEQQVDDLDRERENDPPESNVKTTESPGKIFEVFKIFFSLFEKQNVPQEAPEIHIPVKESKIKSTEQQVGDLDRRRENDPPEMHKQVKESKIKSTEQQVDDLDRERKKDSPESNVKTTESSGKIFEVFKIFFSLFGKQNVPQEAPEIHISVMESKSKSTEQQVDDLDRERENDPPESHVKNVKTTENSGKISKVFKRFCSWFVKQNTPQRAPEIHIPVVESTIKSMEQLVDDLDRRRENDPPMMHKQVKESKIKSTEQQVDDSVKETANGQPESSSWFSLLTTSAYWCKITLLISTIILKYILQRNDLAIILGQYLTFLYLIEVIYEGLGNFNFHWSSEGADLENRGPSLLTDIGEEYCWSEHFQGFVLLLLMMLVLMLEELVVLFILLFKSFNRPCPPLNDNMTPPTSGDSKTETSGDSTSSSDDFTPPTMEEISKRLMDNIVRQVLSSAGPIKPLISQEVRHRPRKPTILPSSARGGIDGYTQTPPLKPKRRRHIACQCPSDIITPTSDNIIPSSSASPQMNELRKNRSLRGHDAVLCHFKPQKTDNITPPSDNITPPMTDNITPPSDNITPPMSENNITPPMTDNITPTSSASPQMKELKRNNLHRILKFFRRRLYGRTYNIKFS